MGSVAVRHLPGVNCSDWASTSRSPIKASAQRLDDQVGAWRVRRTANAVRDIAEAETPRRISKTDRTAGAGVANRAERAVGSGLALEQLSGAESWWHRSVPPRLQVTRDLEEFLSEPQHGARAVAREVFGRVSLRRVAEFGGVEEAAPPVPLDVPDAITSDRVFTDLPHDRMHNRVEYFDHVLRGLRRTPPGYVLDVLNDNPPDPELTTQVAGIAVVTLE